MDKPEPTPQRIGRFEILKPLGEGGMGKVYLAKDPAIGREVALKTITGQQVATEHARERFLHEARAAGTLSHPNLITIHEFGEDQGVLFIVMEYLPGQDLQVYLRNRSLTPKEALEVMALVCDGLAYAHGKGILHRDVKPSNVRIVHEGHRMTVKLMDFGVARLPNSQLTGTGDLVGTLSYMAPEYLRGAEATVQCDLYAVGMMLHEALTGDLPALGPTLPSAPSRRGVAAEAAVKPPPAGLNPHIWELVDKALASNPAQRFATAAEFALALRAAQNPDWNGLYPDADEPSGLVGPVVNELKPRPGMGARVHIPVVLHPPEPSKPFWPWALGLLLAGGGAFYWWKSQEKAPEPAPAPQQAQAEPKPKEPAPAPPPSASNQPNPMLQPPKPAPAPAQPQPQSPAPSSQPDAFAEAQKQQALLQEAEARVKEHPRDAFEAADQVLRSNPTHVQANALRVASLYYEGRYTDVIAALEAARSQGISGQQLGALEVIHGMMDDQRSNTRIPESVKQNLRSYFPPPPGGGPGGQGGPGGPPNH